MHKSAILSLKKISVMGIVIACLLTVVFLFLAGVPGADAQEANSLLWGGQEGNVQEATGLGDSDPRVVIANIIRIILGFLGIIAVILIMYAGWLWTISGGDEQKISQAKKILSNAAVGLVIILMSFAIVTFIMNAFFGATGGGSSGAGSGEPGSGFAGVGAMGSCTIESVYPAPGQRDVPRNVSVIVTFKEAVDPATVCDDANNDGACSGGELVRADRVMIFQEAQGSGSALSEVSVANTSDNQTFVFTPNNYLGSPSEYIWYAALLTNDIQKEDGGGIFGTCGQDEFGWRFEVSNRLDLTPPIVRENGIYPPPDDAQDTVSGTASVQAAGQVGVSAQPRVFSAASATGVDRQPSGAGWSQADVVDINENCEASAPLQVSTDSSDLTQATLNQGSTLLGTGSVTGNRATFGYCGLVLELTSGNFDENCDGTYGECAWEIQIDPVEYADTLTVGSLAYSFVSAGAGAQEIVVGATLADTASNIASAVNGHPDVEASASDNIVDIAAAIAGESGNNIVLDTTNESALNITEMSGGVSGQSNVTVQGRPDKVRNSAIQVNFNEAVYPPNVSGEAALVDDTIAVRCLSVDGSPCDASQDGFFACGDNVCLEGEFILSNQYKTVEFLSNNVCGVNGCGEEVYCLPPNSELRVEINAASLEGCVNCQAKSPYNECIGGHCYDSEENRNHPLSAAPPDGVADVALNSLDGDRSGDAEGPGSFYEENTASGDGDDYAWSFWINDQIDLSPPEIDATAPSHTGTAPLSDPVRVTFNELMMSSSLRTGRTRITNGETEVTHYYFNLESAGGGPLGYWVSKQDHDNSVPPDGYPDYTEAFIEHSVFPEATSFISGAGSGIKDINQNCFNPSSGPACTGAQAVTETEPTCCSGTRTSDAVCP